MRKVSADRLGIILLLSTVASLGLAHAVRQSDVVTF